jgi:hypothetical protein
MSTTTIQERAPLLLVFGSLADRMANILRSRPSLTARIAFAPPEAIHAIAAFMYLAPEADGSDKEVGDLIQQSDPRDLLRMALLRWHLPGRRGRDMGRGPMVESGKAYF